MDPQSTKLFTEIQQNNSTDFLYKAIELCLFITFEILNKW